MSFNIVVWLAVAVTGAVSLVLLHRYGTELTTRHRQLAELQLAGQAHRLGETEDVQQILMRILRATPEYREDIVSLFGSNLVGMPEVVAHLRESAESDGDSLRLRAIQQIIQGNNEGARQLMLQYAENSGGDPEAARWLAGYALERGDVRISKRWFDLYWSSSDRRGAADSIMGTAGIEDSSQVVAHLFQEGLWAEAFAFAERTRAGGELSVELRFVEAVRLDLAKNDAAALRAYQEVLSEKPNHLIALKRVQQLMAE